MGGQWVGRSVLLGMRFCKLSRRGLDGYECGLELRTLSSGGDDDGGSKSREKVECMRRRADHRSIGADGLR